MREENLTDEVFTIDPNQEWVVDDSWCPPMDSYHNEDAIRELTASLIDDFDFSTIDDLNDITITLDLNYPFYESEVHDWMREGF